MIIKIETLERKNKKKNSGPGSFGLEHENLRKIKNKRKKQEVGSEYQRLRLDEEEQEQELGADHDVWKSYQRTEHALSRSSLC